MDIETHLVYRLHCPVISCEEPFSNALSWLSHIDAHHPHIHGTEFIMTGELYRA